MVYVGRGYDEAFAEPQFLDPNSAERANIVVVKNSDGRSDTDIEDDWYDAGEALAILSFLEKQRG